MHCDLLLTRSWRRRLDKSCCRLLQAQQQAQRARADAKLHASQAAAGSGAPARASAQAAEAATVRLHNLYCPCFGGNECVELNACKLLTVHAGTRNEDGGQPFDGDNRIFS